MFVSFCRRVNLVKLFWPTIVAQNMQLQSYDFLGQIYTCTLYITTMLYFILGWIIQVPSTSTNLNPYQMNPLFFLMIWFDPKFPWIIMEFHTSLILLFNFRMFHERTQETKALYRRLVPEIKVPIHYSYLLCS